MSDDDLIASNKVRRGQKVKEETADAAGGGWGNLSRPPERVLMPENVQQPWPAGSHVAECHFVVCVVNEQEKGGGGGKQREDWSRISFGATEQKQQGSPRLRCSRSHR